MVCVQSYFLLILFFSFNFPGHSLHGGLGGSDEDDNQELKRARTAADDSPLDAEDMLPIENNNERDNFFNRPPAEYL